MRINEEYTQTRMQIDRDQIALDAAREIMAVSCCDTSQETARIQCVVLNAINKAKCRERANDG